MDFAGKVMLVGLGTEEESALRLTLRRTGFSRAICAADTCAEALEILRGARFRFLFLSAAIRDLPPLDFLRQANKHAEVWCALVAPKGMERATLNAIALESFRLRRVAGFLLPPWDEGQLLTVQRNFADSIP